MMTETFVIAMIGGRRCAFCAEEVKSVIETGKIIPIPRAPRYILGLTAQRSQALTVLDCRLAIGGADTNSPTDNRAIVVSHAGHSYALVVDQIEDIAEAVTDTCPVPGGLGPNWSRISGGMVETTGGPALLLNVADVIASPDDGVLAA